MTTPDPEEGSQGDQMDQPHRIKRPIPERKKPNRNVLGALGQSDPMLDQASAYGAPTGGHPLGPGFDDAVEPAPADAVSNAESLDLIDKGVRAASDLIDAQIRQGEETAKSLGKGAAGIPLGQNDIYGLLTGLVRTYSDAASKWVDLVGSLAQKVEGLGAGQKEASTGMAQSHGFGLCVTSDGNVETTMELYRPATTLAPQPLMPTSNDASAAIGDIRFEAGASGSAGRLVVRVPKGQAAGAYHGLLLCGASQTPVGALTLRVLEGPDPSAPS